MRICIEAVRCIPESRIQAAHDSVKGLLQRQTPDTEAFWQGAQPLVDRQNGFLILDGTILWEPYSQQIELVYYHWSGKHQQVVKGMNVVTLLWSDGTSIVLVDFKVYDR